MAGLHFVTHAIDLLDIGEHHLGINPPVSHHGVHVVGSQEVRNARIASGTKTKELVYTVLYLSVRNATHAVFVDPVTGIHVLIGQKHDRAIQWHILNY